MIRNNEMVNFTVNEFNVELVRRIRVLEREVSRLSTKDPGAGIVTGLTLDHLNVGTEFGATTGQIRASDVITSDTQFVSLVATGTAPIVTASTTKITNLNADLLDDLHAAISGNNAHVVSTDANGDTTFHRLTITQITGASPLVVSSTTKVANLNADLLDGLDTATSGVSAHVVATDVAGSTTISGVLTTPEITSAANLTLDPTGDIVVNPGGADVLPSTGYVTNIGSLSTKFLTLHAAELWVETLVAQSTMATIGGRILVGTTTQLTSNVTVGATSISVKHNSLANGDFVILEANGAFEVMKITSAPSGGGPYSYTVTRNVDGSGANAWSAGDAVFDTKSAFIDLYSVSGVRSASHAGPTIVGNIRTASVNWSDLAEGWAIGNLNGLYGYGVDTLGAAFGRYGVGFSWISADATNGIRMMKDTTTVVGQWALNGDVTVGEVSASHNNVKITSGAIAIRNNTTERISMTAAGVLTLKDSTGTARITLDSSGNATLDGKLKMEGAASAIAIGTTPPTSATVGTGIWIDRTGMYGLNANTQEAIFKAADGTITAGAGAVKLDSVGLTLDGAVCLVYIGATQMGSIGGDVATLGVNQCIKVRAAGTGVGGRSIELDTINGAGTHRAIVTLDASNGSALIRFNIDASASDILQLAATTVTTKGQIVSSLATGTAPFSITSTTAVTNLNADMVDGHHWSDVPTAANPTASVGLSAVNGSAATYMRSDGAPALSQSIAPTWTGKHSFNASPTNMPAFSPTSAGAPFILGANAQGQIVGGLNADKTDGLDVDASATADAHIVATDISGSIYLAGDAYANGSSKGLQEQIQAVTVYTASGALTLTTSFQDVSGVTTGSFTPSVNETAIVDISVTFNFAAGTANAQVGDSLQAQLDLVFSATDHAQTPVASITVPGTAATGTATTAGIETVVKHYSLSLNASTAYTIKVQAKNNSGNRGSCGAVTQMKVWRIAR